MSYASAKLAIETQLLTPLAGRLTQWPNGPKIKPDGVAYAEVFHLAASTTVDTLGTAGRDLVPHITQVNMYDLCETGESAHVDTFRDSFKAGQWLVNNGQAVLVRACGPGPAQRDGSYYKSIIEIQWEARLAR